jgi:hypothetical protein
VTKNVAIAQENRSYIALLTIYLFLVEKSVAGNNSTWRLQSVAWKWGGEWYGRPGQQSQMVGNLGGKMNILDKKIYFKHPTNFKLLSRI